VHDFPGGADRLVAHPDRHRARGGCAVPRSVATVSTYPASGRDGCCARAWAEPVLRRGWGQTSARLSLGAACQPAGFEATELWKRLTPDVVKRFQSVSDESEEVRLGTDELSTRCGTASRCSRRMAAARSTERAKCPPKNAGRASSIVARTNLRCGSRRIVERPERVGHVQIECASIVLARTASRDDGAD
jgi:hypothetical protein